jgi:hypothetical protein
MTRATLTGKVRTKNIAYGVIEEHNLALIFFPLETDLQTFPIYAKGLPAIAMGRYAQVVEKMTTYPGDKELTVTVELDLMAAERYVLPFAAKIHWYIFGELRDVAELKINQDKKQLYGGLGIPTDWPRNQWRLDRVDKESFFG